MSCKINYETLWKDNMENFEEFGLKKLRKNVINNKHILNCRDISAITTTPLLKYN